MTGVEEQPEGTAEAGQQSTDGHHKETSTPAPAKLQQDEQYEHNRLIYPGSNGGDCGFRAFAIALGQLNNKTAAESMDPTRLQKNVATLRHKVNSRFNTQTAWKQFWARDTKATITTEGGSIPNSAEERLESLKRPTRYICHQVLQALADEYKVSIVIFEMKDRWKPLTTIGTGKKVIPMMLRAQHFYTLQLKEGEKTFPDEWKKKAMETTWTGRASGNRPRIECTPDSMLRSMSTAQSSSTRAPASTVRESPITNRTPRIVKTPHNALRAASEPTSELRAPASTANENRPAGIAEQRRKGDNQAHTPNSTIRALDSTARESRRVKKESKQHKPRTPRTARTTEQNHEGDDQANTPNSTIRVPVSAAQESGHAKKDSKQPETQKSRKQFKVRGTAASSAAETRGRSHPGAGRNCGVSGNRRHSSFDAQQDRHGAHPQRWLAQYRNMQWQCPVCTEWLTLTMPWTKRTHLLKRHPQEVAKRREEEGLRPGQQLSWLRMSEETPKIRTPVLATDELPTAERGWTWWVCENGMPFMHPAQSVLSIRTHLKQHEGVLSSHVKSAHAKRNVKAQNQARAANANRMHQIRRDRGAKNGHDILRKVGANTTCARQPATTPMGL